MKKRLLTRLLPILFLVLLFLSVPCAFLISGFALPAQYDQTYYGELGAMYDKLKNTTGKKLVVLGTSSVAFGVDSALLQSQLALEEEQYHYTVCNFGLYGTLGSKLMLDLSKKYIGEGDVVLFAPEPLPQVLSLYFSAEQTWMAMDGHFSMLWDIDGDNMSSMVGNFAYFAANKQSYFSQGKKPETDDIYMKASFDDNCDMKKDIRPYNIMEGLCDENNPVSLTSSIFSADYVTYVNEYYKEISKRGAKMYYSFAPVNVSGLAEGTTEESIYAYYDYIDKAFDFPVLGDPLNYVMDNAWFFDSNVHLNGAGMTVHTVQILEDLKAEWEIYSPTNVDIPDKPVVPEEPITDGDNSCEGYFNYTLSGDEYTITSLTAEGKKMKSLIVPTMHNGVAVTSFEAKVFAGDKNIEEITLQANIRSIKDDSFNGCTALKKIILKHTDPNKIGVGMGLLDGVPDDCYIYLADQSVKSKFSKGYFWGHYADRLKVI